MKRPTRSHVRRSGIVFAGGWCTSTVGLALLVAAIAGPLAAVGTGLLGLGLGASFLGWAMTDEEVPV